MIYKIDFLISPKLIFGLFCFLILNITNLYLSSPVNYNIKTKYLSPPTMKHFTFGYGEAIADAMWIRAIQDFDYCEQKIAANACKNQSWLYEMLNQITEISPKYRMAYAAGGLALTVIISDIEGASKIFDKGVREFPNDWQILYRAGYHAYFEENNALKAAQLYERAAKNGAPEWLFSLAGRLYADAGNAKLAEELLERMIQEERDPQLIQRLKEKLESLHAPSK